MSYKLTQLDKDEEKNHKEMFGGYNDLPPNWEPMTEKEFSQSKFFVYSPEIMEWRQVNFDLNGRKFFNGIQMYIFHDKTGIAMVHDYWRKKVYYFKFAACKHEYKTLTFAQCRKLGIYHGGRCCHVQKCKKCGYVHAYDSSD